MFNQNIKSVSLKYSNCKFGKKIFMIISGTGSDNLISNASRSPWAVSINICVFILLSLYNDD